MQGAQAPGTGHQPLAPQAPAGLFAFVTHPHSPVDSSQLISRMSPLEYWRMWMYEKHRIKSAFYNAKKNAKARGIPFLFTFEDWVNWWENHLGTHWYKKRGSRRGQYVMARFEDKGPYTAKNTKCILSEDNHIEYNKRRNPSRGWSHKPLDESLVIAIYSSDELYGVIAKKYGVTKHKIQCIKRKHYYRKITDELDVR